MHPHAVERLANAALKSSYNGIYDRLNAPLIMIDYLGFRSGFFLKDFAINILKAF